MSITGGYDPSAGPAPRSPRARAALQDSRLLPAKSLTGGCRGTAAFLPEASMSNGFPRLVLEGTQEVGYTCAWFGAQGGCGPARGARTAAAPQFLRRRGSETASRLQPAPRVLSGSRGCVATTRFLLRLSVSSGSGVVQLGLVGSLKNPPQTKLVRSDRHPSSGRALGRPRAPPPPPAARRPREAPRAPLGRAPRRPHAHAPRRSTRAGPARGRPRAAAAPANTCSRRAGSAAAGAGTSFRRTAAARGVSPSSVHQSPDTSEIRLWGCGERNATQTPFWRTPRK
nr:uncharacterized protein LOC116154736 [Camelus dromedarius]